MCVIESVLSFMIGISTCITLKWLNDVYNEITGKKNREKIKGGDVDEGYDLQNKKGNN